MSFTFISRKSGSTKSGTIILWYGLKADIPPGWEYYSAAAGKLVLGATTASTTALGSSTHTHAYSSKTGVAGSHTHSFTATVEVPINVTVNGFYSATANKEWAERYHTNHTQSLTISTAPDHDHSLSTSGSGNHVPTRFGLYYIRKV